MALQIKLYKWIGLLIALINLFSYLYVANTHSNLETAIMNPLEDKLLRRL